MTCILCSDHYKKNEVNNNDTYETEINAVCDAFDSDDIDEECYDFQDELFNFEIIIEYSRD
jgi:hypothetical protein